MKTVFNVIVALLVIWILWYATCNYNSNTNTASTSNTQVSASTVLSHMKTCQSYFSRPISVTHDRASDVIYISCLNDAESQDKGYICRTNLYGEIIDTMRIPELRQPRGIKVFDDHLYITDINRVIRYNLNNDSIDLVYMIKKSMYLSDIECDPQGNIYVSDSHASCIYKLKGDSAVVFCRDTLCENVTGLCMSNNTLMAGAKNHILKISPQGKAEIFAKTSFSAYGIKSDENGSIIASDFVGNIRYVSPLSQKFIYKKSGDINTADFEYLPEQKLLYLPTYINNSLVLYEIKENL